MKAFYFFLACCIVLLQSCNSDDDSNEINNDMVNGTWNIQNISGGFAGINENFEEGSMVWTFKNGKLKVANLATNSFSYGLESGSYSFKITYADSTPILYIDGQEFGGISLIKNGFTLNQNVMSNGSGADGFIFILLE